MEILIHHAKQNKDAQFVFLTPQDMSFLVNDEDILVHRLVSTFILKGAPTTEA